MIEKVILDYLSEELTVPVLMELPEVPSEDYPTFPEQFVIIEKVGGSRRDYVNSASVALQSYSTKSLYQAAQLDEAVRAAMDGILELPEISGMRLASNYNHTDTRTKRYRYQSVFDFYF